MGLVGQGDLTAQRKDSGAPAALPLPRCFVDLPGEMARWRWAGTLVLDWGSLGTPRIVAGIFVAKTLVSETRYLATTVSCLSTYK